MTTPQRPASRRQILAAAALLGPVGLLTGCNDGAAKTRVTPSPTPNPTPTPSPTPTPEPEPTWPLTGTTGDIVDRPAMTVKIENSAAARPQTGLQEADVVWEEMVEGGITRFGAVYHSQLPETFGPVRSVRPMDPAIAAPYGGLMVFSGGQAPFVAALRDAGLQLFADDLGSPGFSRNPERYAPHNLFGDPEVFLDGADGEHEDAPPEQFAFAESADEATAVTEGEAAQTVRCSFPSATPSWTWDSDEKVWLRSESGADAVTSDAGRITAVNVVVLRVEVVATSFVDPSGASVPETELTGSGEAIVAAGGRTVECTWRKGEDADPLEVTYDDEPVALAPGNTWVELVPTNGGGVSVE